MQSFRNFVLSLILFYTTSSFASHCRDLLLGDEVRTTQNFEVDLVELEDWVLENDHTAIIPDHDSLAFSALAVAYLKAQVNCQDSEKMESQHPFDEDGSECNSIASRRGFTLSCYLEATEGYYITHIGFGETVKVLFSRWD